MANKAPWVKAFPKQAKALRPERSKAGGIKSRSQSEEVRMAVYRPIAEMFKLLNPRCQCCEPIIQSLGANNLSRGLTDDVHHVRGRSGLLLFDTRYFKSACAKCHQWIHSHIEAARKMGLIAKEGD